MYPHTQHLETVNTRKQNSNTSKKWDKMRKHSFSDFTAKINCFCYLKQQNGRYQFYRCGTGSTYFGNKTSAALIQQLHCIIFTGQLHGQTRIPKLLWDSSHQAIRETLMEWLIQMLAKPIAQQTYIEVIEHRIRPLISAVGRSHCGGFFFFPFLFFSFRALMNGSLFVQARCLCSPYAVGMACRSIITY